MRAPHMFATWFMARKLSPDMIVESGIWRGQSTWLLETACPAAKMVCIDLDLGKRTYISEKVTYSDRDFSDHDWSEVTERSLVFFDDHQNAYERLQQCKWLGFKHVIFEDNYPPQHGDCYSLKKAFANVGYDPIVSGGKSLSPGAGFRLLTKRIARAIDSIVVPFLVQYKSNAVAPGSAHSNVLRRNIEIYCEFPPVFKPSETRWGRKWDDVSYPTPEPLLEHPTQPSHKVFVEEAAWYTWICYVKLR
jgi:hypothetical protein